MNFVPDKSGLLNLKNIKVTVMGLGLNGGGIESARFFASRGADVTATDLRDRDILKPALKMLENHKINYVLGKHRIEDFTSADIVIKNPAVPPDSPFLKKARNIETDISVFLKLSPSSRITAITGSKGKSTVSSAVYHGIKSTFPEARLGGNITVSPLSFIDKITDKTPVILELSSWQLADIKNRGLLKPQISVITNILPDHLNMYSGMEEYVSDKKLIYKDQNPKQYTLCFYDDDWGRIFSAETPAKPLYFSAAPLPDGTDGAWLESTGEGFTRSGNKIEKILPSELFIKGQHNRLNLLIAAEVLYISGIDPETIMNSLSCFKGIPHRMEFAGCVNGVSFYNDTAATIPEAAAAAVESFDLPVSLICGGTDKNLDFKCFSRLKNRTGMIYLLEGTATDKIIPYLEKYEIDYSGPYNSLEAAFNASFAGSLSGDSIILSPGCTSFGMFKNEFDRGDSFKALVKKLES